MSVPDQSAQTSNMQGIIIQFYKSNNISIEEWNEKQRNLYEEIKNIAKSSPTRLAEEIQKIGEDESLTPDASQDKIIRIVEQTIGENREAAGLTAVQTFLKRDPLPAAKGLSALYTKAGIGETETETAIRRAIVTGFAKIGTDDALGRLRNIGEFHPEDAIRGAEEFNLADVPGIIASFAMEQSAEGRLTAVQPAALDALNRLHERSWEGGTAYSPNDVNAAAERLAAAVIATRDAALNGGEQYRRNVLDYRPASELNPDRKNISAALDAFERSAENKTITRKTLTAFTTSEINTPGLPAPAV